MKPISTVPRALAYLQTSQVPLPYSFTPFTAMPQDVASIVASWSSTRNMERRAYLQDVEPYDSRKDVIFDMLGLNSKGVPGKLMKMYAETQHAFAQLSGTPYTHMSRFKLPSLSDVQSQANHALSALGPNGVSKLFKREQVINDKMQKETETNPLWKTYRFYASALLEDGFCTMASFMSGSWEQFVTNSYIDHEGYSYPGTFVTGLDSELVGLSPSEVLAIVTDMMMVRAPWYPLAAPHPTLLFAAAIIESALSSFGATIISSWLRPSGTHEYGYSLDITFDTLNPSSPGGFSSDPMFYAKPALIDLVISCMKDQMLHSSLSWYGFDLGVFVEEDHFHLQISVANPGPWMPQASGARVTVVPYSPASASRSGKYKDSVSRVEDVGSSAYMAAIGSYTAISPGTTNDHMRYSLPVLAALDQKGFMLMRAPFSPLMPKWATPTEGKVTGHTRMTDPTSPWPVKPSAAIQPRLLAVTYPSFFMKGKALPIANIVMGRHRPAYERFADAAYPMLKAASIPKSFVEDPYSRYLEPKSVLTTDRTPWGK